MYGRADGRDQLDDGDPPSGRHQQRHAGPDQLAEPAPQGRRRRDEVDEAEGRDHQQGLEHLREEAEADQGEGEEEPAGRGGLQRPDHRVRAGGQQQHEQRVGVVEAEHEHGDRREREHGPGQQAGRGREPAPDRRRRGSPPRPRPPTPAGTRMLHELRPKIRAESAMTHSEAGGLSTVIEAAASDAAEEERLPALRARLRRRPSRSCWPTRTRRGPRGTGPPSRPAARAGPDAPTVRPPPGPRRTSSAHSGEPGGRSWPEEGRADGRRGPGEEARWWTWPPPSTANLGKPSTGRERSLSEPGEPACSVLVADRRSGGNPRPGGGEAAPVAPGASAQGAPRPLPALRTTCYTLVNGTVDCRSMFPPGARAAVGDWGSP